MEELKENKIKQLKKIGKAKTKKVEQEETEAEYYRVVFCSRVNRGSNFYIASLLRCIY